MHRTCTSWAWLWTNKHASCPLHAWLKLQLCVIMALCMQVVEDKLRTLAAFLGEHIARRQARGFAPRSAAGAHHGACLILFVQTACVWCACGMSSLCSTGRASSLHAAVDSYSHRVEAQAGETDLFCWEGMSVRHAPLAITVVGWVLQCEADRAACLKALCNVYRSSLK